MKKYIGLLFLMGLLVGCSTSKEVKYKDGQYLGVGEGKCGTIQIMVSVSEGKISSIETVKSNETPSYMKEVEDKLYTAIIETNGDEEALDSVTGATDSSTGAINAIKLALFDALSDEYKTEGSHE